MLEGEVLVLKLVAIDGLTARAVEVGKVAPLAHCAVVEGAKPPAPACEAQRRTEIREEEEGNNALNWGMIRWKGQPL